MTLFLVVGTTPFDGSQSITLRDKTDPSNPEDFTYYPKSRDTPAAAWKQFWHIAKQSYLTITESKQLMVWNSAAFDLIFSSSALASAFGFSSTTTSGSANSTIVAGTALTAFEFSHVDTKVTRSGSGVSGHGSSVAGAQSSSVEINAVGTRTNASGLISAIEQSGYLSVADTYYGGIPWTLHVENLKFKGAGTTLAQLEITGTTRI